MMSSILVVVMALAGAQGTAKPAVVVKFHEPKLDISPESASPIDPIIRVQIQNSPGMGFGLNADGIRLTFSNGAARTTFKIDNQIVFPNAPQPQSLPSKTPAGKARHGYFSSFRHGNLNITYVIEAVPTRPARPGTPRRMDAALIRYLIENKDTQPHSIGTRVHIDTHCNNDGALFAAPTLPKQILDGMTLKEKTLPPYVQILQNPDLNNPINMGHFALKLGQRMIGPDRFVCTGNGAAENGWEVNVQKAMGDSACALYWQDQTVLPGGAITMAFAYGKGLAVSPESEGRVSLAFGGSFEPGKLFTIAATIDEPVSNQSLALELPAGMELVEGKHIQAVAPPGADSATSMVLWKCRVKDLGEHTLRIRSTTGVTQTRTLTISR